MHYFFGDKKEEKKVTNELAVQIKAQLKTQFCQYCHKVPSNKISFVPNTKIGFTCNNCQLMAVGGDLKNLGEKTLITNDKFADSLINSLISYQSSQAQPPENYKQIQTSGKNVIKNTFELIQKIKVQYGAIKTSTEQKMNELIKQSQQQNSIYVFDELCRMSKDKKNILEDIKYVVLKRSLVNEKGLHFIDQENINQANCKIAQKLVTLKGQTRLKLKEINQLSKWISEIEI